MQTIEPPKTRIPRRVFGLSLAALTAWAALSPDHIQANHGQPRPVIQGRMKINAGTVFNLDANLHHEVRGIAQVSNLGNCRVYFDVNLFPCASGEHFLCAVGTMTLTTLAGDKLHTEVVGWIDFDPNDPKVPPSVGNFHYDVTVKGGTGKLAEARGRGEINGAAMFVGPDGPEDADPTDDGFCDGYEGVATWLYEGVLLLPRQSK